MADEQHKGSSFPLVDAFQERTAIGSTEPAALEGMLAKAHEDAARAWPGIALDARQFVRRLARHVAPGTDPTLALSGCDVCGVFLTEACLRQIAGAADQLDRLLVRETSVAAATIDPSPAFAAEVAQAVRIKLLAPSSGGPPRCAEFAGRGPLKAWLRMTALRTALDLRRTAKPTEPLDVLADRPAPASSPELGAIRDRFRGDFKEAFRLALRSLDSRERTLLRLHHIDQISLVQIGRHYRVYRTTVASWLERARQKLLDSTRGALGERLSLSRAEVDSLIQLLGSQLSVSLQEVRKSTNG